VFEVAGDRAILRRVDLGQRTDLLAEVVGGLKEGAVVILHPEDAIQDGAKVAPVPPAETAP
jgi:HlyD family secretion protein